MTSLDATFVRQAQQEGYRFSFGDSEFEFRATRAVRYLGPIPTPADLELVNGEGNVLGYVTPYGESEHGAVKAAAFDIGLPTVFRSVEDAAREILT